MKKLLILLLLITFIGCTLERPERKDKVFYEYTIWLGSATIAVGDDTHDYRIADGMIYYVDGDDIDTTIVPMDKVFKIEKNTPK